MGWVRETRIVVYLAIAVVGLSLVIGFWPVYANVDGNASYNCGSGFVHNNGNQWNIDSQSLVYQRTAADTATGTPSQVCPDKVHHQRDLAVFIMVIAILIGWLNVVFTAGPRDRTSRAMFGTPRVSQWR